MRASSATVLGRGDHDDAEAAAWPEAARHLQGLVVAGCEPDEMASAGLRDPEALKRFGLKMDESISGS